MERKDKKKIKKQIKKQVKKQIKKQIKRNIRTPSEARKSGPNGKRLTPEEQSKQIEAMKVMLTRPGVVGFQSDPQYRDLMQKNQQLDERINQRQALLNSMRAGIEQKEQREKEYDQKRIDLKKLQKEHKEESEHKKRMEDIQDKIDDLNEDMRTLKGEDEVGRLQLILKSTQEDLKKHERIVNDNKLFNKVKILSEAITDTNNQRVALINTINSPEFQHPDSAIVKLLTQQEIEKQKLQQALEVKKRQEEINEMQKELYIKEAREEQYYKPQKMTWKRGPDGKPVYTRDWNGKKKIVMVPDFLSSQYGQYVKQIAEKEKEKAKIQNKLDIQEIRSKPISEEAKALQRKAYLDEQERLINSPEYKEQIKQIVNKQIETDFLNKKNEFKEQEIKALKVQQNQEANIRTLDAVRQTGIYDPNTIGNVIAQINDEQNQRLKAEIPKSIAISEHNDLWKEFQTNYGGKALNIYNDLLTNANHQEINDRMDVSQINELNRLMKYTLDNLENQDEYNDFVNSDDIKNFFK